MSKFFPVNRKIGANPVLLNFDSVAFIETAKDGQGSIVHFVGGTDMSSSTLAIQETIDEIRNALN